MIRKGGEVALCGRQTRGRKGAGPSSQPGTQGLRRECPWHTHRSSRGLAPHMEGSGSCRIGAVVTGMRWGQTMERFEISAKEMPISKVGIHNTK